MTANKGPAIVGIDVSSRSKALGLVDAVSGLAGMLKVGHQLFMAEGPAIVAEIVERGERVFLDLKIHDIPNTASRAALEAARLGVSMMTVHASGGREMIAATIRDLEASFAGKRPLIVAVTVLTSIDPATLAATGVRGRLSDQVLRLGRMALDAGADGLVCSAHEIGILRTEFGAAPTIVTPGVRMPGQSPDDQQRVATPAEAVAAGANYVVIGRYVNQAKNPRVALEEVIGSFGS